MIVHCFALFECVT